MLLDASSMETIKNQEKINTVNAPEPPMDAEQFKDNLLQDMKKHRQNGTYRDWYEELLIKWLQMQISICHDDVVKTCLYEYPPENYSDTDYAIAFFRAFPKAVSMEKEVSRIARLVREITRRPLLLERNLPQVRELLSWNNQDYTEDICHTLPMAMELYAATFLILAESVSLFGEVKHEAPMLEPWEKKLLQQPNIEAVAKCIQSNFFVSKKVDDYLDYIAEKGAKELTPLFVSLKYKNCNRN